MENKPFIEAEIQDLFIKQFSKGEISFSRMVELINEKAIVWFKEKHNQLCMPLLDIKTSENQNIEGKTDEELEHEIWDIIMDDLQEVGAIACAEKIMNLIKEQFASQLPAQENKLTYNKAEAIFNAGREKIKHPDWDYVYEDFDAYVASKEYPSQLPASQEGDKKLDMVDWFKEYLKNTPIEQIKKEYEEAGLQFGEISPSPLPVSPQNIQEVSDCKKEFYEYGKSLGIKINDLQRLAMLRDKMMGYKQEDKQ